MKFNLILSLVLILFLTCQCSNQHQAIESVQIEGQLTLPDISTLFLVSSFEDTLKSIDLTPTNTFAIELPQAKEGYYSLKLGKDKIHLYLSPGDELRLQITEDTLLITGKGAARNNYLKRKYSPEFDWYSNYYETEQKGDLITYYRDQYTKHLQQELAKISDESQFVSREGKELDYELANQLLTNQISLETNPQTDESLRKDMNWAKAIKIDDFDALNSSKAYIALVAKILISQQDPTESDLNTFYDAINHPHLKEHFLSSLILPLYKELQFGEDDFEKAVIVESFLTNQQPQDSIGAYLFNLYHKFEDAVGETASFTYEDVNGHKVSLADFRGKYVYIDFWATWCVNCIKEFPHLEALEEEFRGEELAFIGISIDKQAAKDKWKKMVANKHLSNTQLFSPVQGYPEKDPITYPFSNLIYLNSYYLGIPHYALIDPAGKIVDAFFYRPSNKKTGEYLSDLLGQETSN